MSTEPVVLGRGLPAWWLRVAIAAVSAAMIGLSAVHGLSFPLILVFAVVAAVAVLLPSSPAMTVLIGVVAVAAAILDGDVVDPTVVALIPLVHFGHVVAGVAGVIPLRSRLHLSAFRAPVRRFLLIQVAVLLLAAVAVVVPAGDSDALVEVLGLVAVAAIAVLALPKR